MDNRDQSMTASDDSFFWSLHLPRLRGVGIQAPPEPAPAPVPVPEPDLSSMTMAQYQEYRAERGLDSSDFVGVRPWRYRHLPTQPTE